METRNKFGRNSGAKNWENGKPHSFVILFDMNGVILLYDWFDCMWAGENDFKFNVMHAPIEPSAFVCRICTIAQVSFVVFFLYSLTSSLRSASLFDSCTKTLQRIHTHIHIETLLIMSRRAMSNELSMSMSKIEHWIVHLSKQ